MGTAEVKGKTWGQVTRREHFTLEKLSTFESKIKTITTARVLTTIVICYWLLYELP